MGKFGDHPAVIGEYIVKDLEMMFYQYQPIKLIGQTDLFVEDRLKPFNDIIGASCCDFIGTFGLDRFVDSYVYITAKYMYQPPNCSYNRFGYHSDGFLTDDINYIWCDVCPTVFNSSEFNLTLDDVISMGEMEEQALKENEYVYPDNTLLRLDQFNIHKVAENTVGQFRAFVKLSVSKDKYDLLGNSHNYLLNYKWDMKKRKVERNIPQSN